MSLLRHSAFGGTDRRVGRSADNRREGLQYWYLFPASIVIATVANGAGVGGATFFSPLFVLGLGLDPVVAIGTALITEVFGFLSGVIAHFRARAIDWKVAGMLLTVSVPMAVIGSLFGQQVDPAVLKAILGAGLLLIAIAFILHRSHEQDDHEIAHGIGVVKPYVVHKIVTADGSTYEYRLCRRNEGRFASAIGGLFVGMISTGLGELNTFALVKRCRIPSRITIATGVVVVAVTALAASLTHLVDFLSEGTAVLGTVGTLVAFTVPGVIIGGQLGPLVSKYVPEVPLIRALGWLFLGVGLVTLIEAI